MVQAPITNTENGETEWKMISGKTELERTIIDQNVQHLKKAGERPFAHGRYYKELRNEFTREDTVKSLLEGDSDWTHPLNEERVDTITKITI